MSSTSRSLALRAFLLVGAAIAPGCGGSSGSGDGGLADGIDGGLVYGTGGAVGLGGGGIVATGGGGTLGGSGGSSAPACGQAGLPCCDGNACSGGGCCVTGICMAVGGSCVGLGGGLCNNGACGECGGRDMACCVGDKAAACTAPSTACNDGKCSPCGELGSPCCPSTSGGTGKCKGANAVCDSKNFCMACGMPGTPCCSANQCNSPGCCHEGTCVSEGVACGTSGTCQAGRCSGCGSADQPCCANSCYNGLLCKSGSCTPCGAVDQVCCPAGAATSACQSGTTCTTDGKCARCGVAGDICCPGNTCTDGCCQNGRCMAASTCPSPDGGPADAPLGGSDGNPGTGGIIGAGGVTGTGGTTSSGGVTGTGGIVGSGGTTTPWTAPAGCGDGLVTPPERCDDGNTMPFDGCSSDCQPEPTCTGSGPCASKCGDGIVVGEECDDGNTADGDGCSTSCKVESGFACAQPLGDKILVPVVYRDFKYGKPSDFEGTAITGSKKAAVGMVNVDLDAEGKPAYTNLVEPPSSVRVQSATTFASWYRNTEGVNHATPSKLALWDNHNGAYVNRYGTNGEQWPVTDTAMWCGNEGVEALDADGKPIPCTYKYSTSGYQTDCDELDASGYTRLKCTVSGGTYRGIYLLENVDGNPLFFPVDGDAFSASEKETATIPSEPEGMYDASGMWPDEATVTGSSVQHNFSFTSEIRYWFKYEAGKSYTLDIVGDDDVWVFVNKKLAVDLGGIHMPVPGSVTLNDTTASTYGLEPGNVYEVAVFQAERQSTSSTFKLTLAGFSLAPSQCQRN